MNTSTEIIEVSIQPPIALQRADERFILFLKKCTFPVTEDQIISWYKEYVQLKSQKVMQVQDLESGIWHYESSDYDPETLRAYALSWFDRSLGRTIRKAIIPKEAIKLLSPKLDGVL